LARKLRLLGMTNQKLKLTHAPKFGSDFEVFEHRQGKKTIMS
jgi:hypothetical protein